jgi:tRNA pseudouridine38-40 synthase
VANFLTRWPHPAETLVTALNDRLSEDIGIVAATEVAPDFHARHSASTRVYRYHVVKRRSVFSKRHAWVVPRRINLKRLKEATDLVVGFHDFGAFTDQRLAQGQSTTVAVSHAAWKDLPDVLVFRIAASHFLARMVRRLVGSLVRVGTGELAPETFREWLEAGKGEAAPLTAPSMGLFLEHVEYPAHLVQEWKSQTHPTAKRAVAALASLDGEAGEAASTEEE